MKTNQHGLVILILVISVSMSGCGSGQLFGPTITPTPTMTMTPTILPTISPTIIPSIMPTMTPTITSTPVPLPDPSGVIQENGLTAYLGDFRCIDPAVCKAYTKPGTGLILQLLVDGSKFSLVLNRDPGLSITLVKKILSALYPDLVSEIMNAIPVKGTSGDVITGQGGNENYNWTVTGVWGLVIEVDIEPK
ncbi:MAG: hypothetical protein AB9891_06945 [Anaerolineaceae bacterium]